MSHENLDGIRQSLHENYSFCVKVGTLLGNESSSFRAPLLRSNKRNVKPFGTEKRTEWTAIITSYGEIKLNSGFDADELSFLTRSYVFPFPYRSKEQGKTYKRTAKNRSCAPSFKVQRKGFWILQS